MMHPLLNKNAKHYQNDNKTAIEDFEERYTIIQLLSWAEITINKYEYRKDKKGQKESDLEKIQDYKRYVALLKQIIKTNSNLMFEKAKIAYQRAGIEIEYKVFE